jgi:secondary thiamine-phosphate synthase enzyme
MQKTIEVRTGARSVLVDITDQVQRAVREMKVKDGVVQLFSLHTTAGLTINENADPSVVEDLLRHLERLVPHTGDYRHTEGNSDAHIKASLMGFSVAVPVSNGVLVLGTWQAIYFCEFDGPRTRRVMITA